MTANYPVKKAVFVISIIAQKRMQTAGSITLKLPNEPLKLNAKREEILCAGLL